MQPGDRQLLVKTPTKARLLVKITNKGVNTNKGVKVQ